MSTSAQPQKIRCELPSSLSVYHDFVQDILEKLTALGWDEKTLFGVHVALEESITNAIRHGNRRDHMRRHSMRGRRIIARSHCRP